MALRSFTATRLGFLFTPLHSWFTYRSDRKLCFWCKRVIIHTFSNDGASVLVCSHWHQPLSGVQDVTHSSPSESEGPLAAAFSVFVVSPASDHLATTIFVFSNWIKVSLKVEKNLCFFLSFNWWLWWMTLSSNFAEMHARDAWRTIIGVCTHIKASQVQAGTVMIISHVPEKIRELTEVIRTFDCLLLLLRFCLLGCYNDPFVSCQTSQWYSKGREHDVFSVLCLNDIPISTCVNFCQLLCNEIYVWDHRGHFSSSFSWLQNRMITDHRAKPQRCSCKLWFLTTWEHSSRSKVKISQGSEICF